MGQLLNPLQGSIFVIKAVARDPPKLYRQNLSPYFSKYDRYHAVLMATRGIKLNFQYILNFEFAPWSYTRLCVWSCISARRWGVVYCKNMVKSEVFKQLSFCTQFILWWKGTFSILFLCVYNLRFQYPTFFDWVFKTWFNFFVFFSLYEVCMPFSSLTHVLCIVGPCSQLVECRGCSTCTNSWRVS